MSGNIKRLLMLLLLIVSCLPCALCALVKAGCFPLAWRLPVLPERVVVYSSPYGTYSAFKYVHGRIPEGSVLLCFRPSDILYLYYAERKLICDCDPRLRGLYAARDKTEAMARLRELGVDYLCVPPSEPPTVSMTPVKWIISDASLTECVYDSDNNRIYKLPVRGGPLVNQSSGKSGAP